MRRVSILTLLFLSPAQAELEVVASELVSRQPDGLGQVVEADLDNDGDHDLLVTGRNNDFLGWIECSSEGPVGPLRWIDTGGLRIRVRGQRPFAADLDGDGLVDLHFPGWVLKNRFRRFDPPAAHALTEGYQLCADDPGLLVGRHLESGEWTLFTRTGAEAVGTAEGVLVSPPVDPTLCLILPSPFPYSERPTLIIPSDGASHGTKQLANGLYALRPAENGLFLPARQMFHLPECVSAVYNYSGKTRPEFVAAASSGNDESDAFTSIRLVQPADNKTIYGAGYTGFRTLGLTARSGANSSLPEIVATLGPRTGEGRCSIASMAVTANHMYGLESRGVVPIEEEGILTPFLSRDLKSVAWSAVAAPDQTRPAPEAILSCTVKKIRTGDSSKTLQEELLHGPFGRLEHAEWHKRDPTDETHLLAATSWIGGAMAVSAAGPQVPKPLHFLVPDMLRHPSLRRHAAGPPRFIDLDLDGDKDFVRASTFPGADMGFFAVAAAENLGSLAFSPMIAGYSIPLFSNEVASGLLRVESGASGTHVLAWKPGLLTSTGFGTYGYGYTSMTVSPGTNAQVVAADHDIDGDGHLDFVFFPSVFGHAIAWGKWNPQGRHLDSLLPVAEVSAEHSVTKLESGDLDGDGTPDLFQLLPGGDGMEVSWAACRLAGGTLTGFPHPGTTFPSADTHAVAVNIDGDADIDILRFIAAPLAPADEDGVREHRLEWSEFIGGMWIHHETELGRLRVSPELEPAVHAEGGRMIVINRIGEILEIRTRAATVTDSLAAALAGSGATGCSAAPHLDPDGDGIPNFAEALAGTSPFHPDSGFAVPLASAADGWIAKLPLCLESCGIVACLETSDDLVVWKRVESEPVALADNPGSHTYHFAAPEPPDLRRRFARLVFSCP